MTAEAKAAKEDLAKYIVARGGSEEMLESWVVSSPTYSKASRCAHLPLEQAVRKSGASGYDFKPNKCVRALYLHMHKQTDECAPS